MTVAVVSGIVVVVLYTMGAGWLVAYVPAPVAVVVMEKSSGSVIPFWAAHDAGSRPFGGVSGVDG